MFYRYCRTLDDIVDEPDVQDRAGDLEFWRAEVERMFASEPMTPLGTELAAFVKKYGVKKEYFASLIDGMDMDLRGERYRTFQDLDKYIYCVAGTVGLVCLDIFGVPPSARSREYALTLARAVQLTNIVRDIYEDAGLGRCYFPQKLLEKYSISMEDILERNTAKTALLLKDAGERADNFYKEATALMPAEYKKQLLPARIMGAVYRRNLKKIARAGFTFRDKIKLTKFEKLAAVLGALR